MKFWSKAEAIAQKYEYNDQLALLYLALGYAVTEGNIPDSGKDDKGASRHPASANSALRNFQLALIYGLRFNRFLLDTLLTGGMVSPLKPLVPYLKNKGKKGQKYLQALRDEWRKGKNEITTSRRGTLSVLPEGISRKEAEHIAREREPGTGTLQKTVVEQLRTLPQ